MAMDEYDIQNLPSESLLLCVVSTTGDGVAPLNMRKSWKFMLRKDLPKDALAG
jgi:sulfite reductase alpha subunit-like flavoprotein